MSTKTILIVEDDSSLNLLLKFRFEETNYRVITADNGKDAVELVKQYNPDIIISDIMMPIMSGLEVVEYVRKDLGNQTPIIILSNAGQEEIVMKAFNIGANDFLNKPFIINELLVRVKRILAA